MRAWTCLISEVRLHDSSTPRIEGCSETVSEACGIATAGTFAQKEWHAI